MIIMSTSDAKAYCLAVAQLIPIFLIALYIIDTRWVKENETDAAKIKGIQNAYAVRAIFGIILGIVGEVIALWGALGLINRLFAVASGTAIAIFITGILSESAIDRLDWKFKDTWARFLRGFWLVITIMAALATFIWIFVAVEVIS
jgi:hypothetical protein